jgi:arginase family enzyme
LSHWDKPGRPDAIALRARISERTPRDLRGVDLLAARFRELGRGIHEVPGRRGPFGETDWRDDLAASRVVLESVAGGLRQRFALGSPTFTVASDCALALGTLPAVHAEIPAARVLWLDAHSDYDTPQTSTIGFLGCMSLAGATGAWDAGLGSLPADRVVLAGVRGGLEEFDGAGRAAADASPVTVIPPSPTLATDALAALGEAPVYVHFDPDVLDPGENPVPYARPGGLSLVEVAELLRAVAERGPVVGVEITAFHSDDHRSVREALADRLIECVRPLVYFSQSPIS